MPMKRVIAVTILALFGLAPAVGAACEYNQAMASSTPAEQLGLAPAPAASKTAPAVAKAPVAKAQKQAVSKDKAPAQDKVASVSGR
jgi:hypothetical protein